MSTTHNSDSTKSAPRSHSRILSTFFILGFVALALTLVSTPAQAQTDSQYVVVQHASEDHDDSDSDNHLHLDTPGEPRVVVNAAETSVIALKARVTNLDNGKVQMIDLAKPNDHAQAQVGDKLRVELIGTAIIDGNGVAVRVPANFGVAAGSWRIDTAPADAPHAVIVHARQPNSANRGNPEGRSGVGYEVRGKYDMKPKFYQGRVTFEIADARGDFGDDTSSAAIAQPRRDEARWAQAEKIAEDLSQIDFYPDGLDEESIELIYNGGLEGIRMVANAQVERAESANAMRGRSSEAALAHAYRHLLGRNGGVQAIRTADPTGFRNNLQLLDRSGYRAVVMEFINSPEFRRVHDLDGFERLMQMQTTNDGQRTVFDEEGRRIVVRDTRPN